MLDGSLFGKEKNYQNLSLDTNELVNQLIMSCSLKSSRIQLLELTMFSNRSKTCLSYMRLQGVEQKYFIKLLIKLNKKFYKFTDDIQH